MSKPVESKNHWIRNTLITLVICGMIGMLLAGVIFFRIDPTNTTASAFIQFSFDGAASGIGPNGVRINLGGLTSDDVLQKALSAASLEEYSLEEIRGSLTVTGVYPDNLVRKMTTFDSLMNFEANREVSISEYHPTLFSVVLSNRFDKSVSQTQLANLLWNIMKVFQENFINRHSFVFTPAEDAARAISDYDYVQQVDIITNWINQEARFAREMYEREPLFLLNGKGFNDIAVQLENLISSDVSRLASSITMNALTKDTERLITQYQFEIREQNIKLEEQQERLEHVDGLIDSYEKNEIIYLSTSDSLTKIDGNSSETYDSLVQERKTVSDGITQIKSRIESYRLRLSDLMKSNVELAIATPTEEEEAENTAQSTKEFLTESESTANVIVTDVASKNQITVLENDIRNLIHKLESVNTAFSEMLEAYNQQELNEATVSVFGYKIRTPKLLSVSYIKQAIKCAGPLCSVALMVCVILQIRRTKKEEAENRD